MTLANVLSLSDALARQRELPFEFMQNRFNEYDARNTALREQFVENRRVPERLSETALNNFDNEFNLESRQMNRPSLMETARLNAQVGLGNTQYDLRTLQDQQQLADLQRRAQTAAANNQILTAEADMQFANAVSGSFGDAEREIFESVDEFLAQTSSNPLLRERAREEVRGRFASQITTFDRAFTDLERIMRNSRDGGASEVERARAQAIITQEYPVIQSLYERNMLTSDERAAYEFVLSVRPQTSSEEPETNTTADPDTTVTDQPSPQTTPEPEETSILTRPLVRGQDDAAIMELTVSTPVPETSAERERLSLELGQILEAALEADLNPVVITELENKISEVLLPNVLEEQQDIRIQSEIDSIEALIVELEGQILQQPDLSEDELRMIAQQIALGRAKVAELKSTLSTGLGIPTSPDNTVDFTVPEDQLLDTLLEME